MSARVGTARRWTRGRLRGLVIAGYEALDPAALPWSEMRGKEPLPAGFGVAKRSPSRLVLSFEFRGERLFAKLESPGTLSNRVSALLQGSKTRREWDLARRVLAAGFVVPEPVLWASGPDADGQSISYLVTRGFPDEWRTVRRALRGGAKRHQELWIALAEFAGRLHAADVYHMDFRADHIYVTGGDPAFAFLDLDGSRVGWKLTPHARRRALVLLFRSLLGRPLKRTRVRQFLEHYAPAEVSPDEADELFERAQGGT